MEAKSKITRTAILDKPYTINYYGNYTYPVGSKFTIGTRKGMNKLLEDGILVILGHGVDDVIPNEYFHIEEVTETTVTSKVISKKIV